MAFALPPSWTALKLSPYKGLSQALRVGVIYSLEDYRTESVSGLALTGSYQLSPVLRVGGIYALRHETFDNLGLNATLSLGPLQVVAATDNIITAFQPKDSNQANLRLGLNLVFGKAAE